MIAGFSGRIGETIWSEYRLRMAIKDLASNEVLAHEPNQCNEAYTASTLYPANAT